MIVFLWIGFVGAWLLFAGPVYQAAVELREQGFSRDEGSAFRLLVEQAPPPPRLNPLWWLLPPVAYFVNQARRRRWQQEVLHLLDPDGRERFLTFQNKAAGWLTVGMGAFAIAVKETAELIHESGWSWWLLIPMLLVPFLLSVGYTASRMRQDDEAKSIPAGTDAGAASANGSAAASDE